MCASSNKTGDIEHRDSGTIVDDARVNGNGAVTYGDALGDGNALDGGREACAPGRWILQGEVSNARDIGGWPLENGAKVACGVLYRGAALLKLTDQGCAEFARLGIRTVVDLRVPSERLSAPQAACVQQGARIVLAPMPIPSGSPYNYLAELNTTDSIAAAFAVLGNMNAYPIYFNCVYGRDRTGVLVAVILLALGATREEIMAEYQLTRDAGLSTSPASLDAALDQIDKQGGVGAYLASAGIAPDEIKNLRAQAIAP
jgi:hypothetical protein